MRHDSRCRHPRPTWRHLVLLSWAGMRGVDSLAAALALPFVTRTKAPFPQRGLIVFITFSVILGTLVLQGIDAAAAHPCWLKIVDDRSLEEEERLARLKANQAALARLGGNGEVPHDGRRPCSSVCAMNMKSASSN